MKAHLLTALLVLSVATASNTLVAQTPVSSGFAATLQAKLDSCKNTWDIPGISVSLLLPNDEYWNGVSGLSHIYNSEPVTEEMVFMQCSVTKLYVATMIFQLIEDGELTLDDTVGQYLPAIQHIPSGTKIRYLLNQRSGIYDFISQNPATSSTWFSNPDSIWDRKTAIETYGSAPIFTQNASWSYSNPNYILLGMIIESITGTSVAQALHDLITDPYGLNHTFLEHEDVITDPKVYGWTSFSASNVYDTDAGYVINDCSASMISTAGFIHATESDVARFTKLLFDGGIISTTSLNTMKTVTNVNFSDGATGYGYGTMHYSFNGKSYFGHGGDFSGFTMLTISRMDKDVTLAIGINRNNAPRKFIADALLDVVESYLASAEVIEEEAGKITVWPNPADETLNISEAPDTPAGSRIELWNQLGQLVVSKEYTTAAEPAALDVSHLEPGMYVVKVCNGQMIRAERVIVR